jgi:hypothetical protein
MYRSLQCVCSTRLAADLIDDDNLVLRQLGVSSEHAQQHALCQKGDLCAAAGCGIKSHSVCNVISVLLEGLKRNPAPNSKFVLKYSKGQSGETETLG